jgi:hypothetical protein
MTITPTKPGQPMPTLDENAARATINRMIGELQDEHPHDSAEELFERFSKLMNADPSLREAFLLSGFSSICDEMLDKLVQLGKRVPSALKKPN